MVGKGVASAQAHSYASPSIRDARYIVWLVGGGLGVSEMKTSFAATADADFDLNALFGATKCRIFAISADTFNRGACLVRLEHISKHLGILTYAVLVQRPHLLLVQLYNKPFV